MPSPRNTEPQRDSADAGLCVDHSCIARSLQPDSLSATHVTRDQNLWQKRRRIARLHPFWAARCCRRQGKEFEQSYEQGKPITELSETPLPRKLAKQTGTQIRFLYDKKVFSKGYATLLRAPTSWRLLTPATQKVLFISNSAGPDAGCLYV